MFLSWLLFAGCAVALFTPDVFANATCLHGIATATTGLPNVFLTIGALLAFVLPAAVAFQKLRSITLRKLNLKNCEIEIAEEKDPSALNKHLDEILYFFEETNFDVVVLEDLDRFRTTDVFTKLREINTLVNRNVQARRHDWWRGLSRSPRRVVFIYAIKDDMFTGEERTKFFDLVIPVIPVVNHINSRELLTQALRARGFTDIGDELVNDVAIFVRDMRLLHNVVNEYTVYRHRLNMRGLDPEKLFAMILYKNVCPEDFANLHKSKGDLHACIASKAGLVDQATEESLAELNQLREKISDVERMQKVSVCQLRSSYLFELSKQEAGLRWTNIVLGDKGYQWGSLVEDVPFALLSGVNGWVNDFQGRRFRLSFPEAEKAVDPKHTYAEREELILAQEGRTRKQIERRLSQLDTRLRGLRHAKLKELLEILGSEVLAPSIPEIVTAMLRKGYIDETYLSYLSYFYEGSLSNSDWVFVQGVKTGQAFDPDYALDNVSEIVEHNLGSDEAISLATKNIHLLHYFAGKGTAAFGRIAAQLQRETRAAVDLVTLCMERVEDGSSVLVPVIYECWPEFWTAVMEHDELSVIEWSRHVEALVIHTTMQHLKTVCERTELRRDIARDDRFLLLAESTSEVDRVIGFLDAVRPCFRKLPDWQNTSEINRLIYEHGMYEMTPHNVRLMHSIFVGPLSDDLPPSITHLRKQEDCALSRHIEGSIERYVDILIGALLSFPWVEPGFRR
jgi:hypothetical protein